MTVREFDECDWTMNDIVDFIYENDDDCLYEYVHGFDRVYNNTEIDEKIEEELYDMVHSNHGANWLDVHSWLDKMVRDDVNIADYVFIDYDGEYIPLHGEDTAEWNTIVADLIDAVREAAIDLHILEGDEEDDETGSEQVRDNHEPFDVENWEWDPMKGYDAPEEGVYAKYVKEEHSDTADKDKEVMKFYELMSSVNSEVEFQTLKLDDEIVANLYDGE